MTARVWTVRQLLEGAIARLGPLQANAFLVAAEQALCGELSQADTLALNALRLDDTIPAGQRTARAQQIEDKVFALDIVDKNHQNEISVDELYAAMDMSASAAGLIRRGVPSAVLDYAWRWKGQEGDPVS